MQSIQPALTLMEIYQAQPRISLMEWLVQTRLRSFNSPLQAALPQFLFQMSLNQSLPLHLSSGLSHRSSRMERSIWPQFKIKMLRPCKALYSSSRRTTHSLVIPTFLSLASRLSSSRTIQSTTFSGITSLALLTLQAMSKCAQSFSLAAWTIPIPDSSLQRMEAPSTWVSLSIFSSTPTLLHSKASKASPWQSWGFGPQWWPESKSWITDFTRLITKGQETLKHTISF